MTGNSFLDKFQDKEMLRTFVVKNEDNEITKFGFLITWSRKGVGVGEIKVQYDIKSSKWTYDTEHMDDEFVSEIFNALNSRFDEINKLKLIN